MPEASERRSAACLCRSMLFYVGLFLSTVLCGTACMVTGTVMRRPDLAHLTARLWGNINLWTAGVTVRIRGLHHIQPNHPYIFAANHQSWFDIFAVLGKLPVQFRWLAKEELFRIPILGPAMAATGYIPIDRADRRKAYASINEAASRVRNGTSIVIFPEGTRSNDGVLQDFKKGGFVLSIQSQQPMVPVSISGSHRILPKKGGWIIRPGIIHMTVSAPIPTAGCDMKDRNMLISSVREAIRVHLRQAEGGLLPDDGADHGAI